MLYFAYTTSTYLYVSSVTLIFPFTPVVSVRLVRLTAFPNRQYLGIRCPITPPTTSPEWIPNVTLKTNKNCRETGKKDLFLFFFLKKNVDVIFSIWTFDRSQSFSSTYDLKWYWKLRMDTRKLKTNWPEHFLWKQKFFFQIEIQLQVT